MVLLIYNLDLKRKELIAHLFSWKKYFEHVEVYELGNKINIEFSDGKGEFESAKFIAYKNGGWNCKAEKVTKK